MTPRLPPGVPGGGITGVLCEPISGGAWREFFFIGVPFYSVLPDPAKYPAFGRAGSDRTVAAANGSERIISMCDARIEEDLPEILAAARSLIEGRWTFERCLEIRRRQWARLYYGQPRKAAALFMAPFRFAARRAIKRIAAQLGVTRS